MDGQPGWLTLRYAFSWVRLHGAERLDTLALQSELRWPTNWHAVDQWATVGYGKSGFTA